jgi:hypothetical protein
MKRAIAILQKFRACWVRPPVGQTGGEKVEDGDSVYVFPRLGALPQRLAAHPCAKAADVVAALKSRKVKVSLPHMHKLKPKRTPKRRANAAGGDKLTA